MADKFAGGIIASSADVTVPVVLRVKSDGAELTGKIASAVDCHYWRQGGLVVTFTAATLASADGNHSDGGWYIMNDTLMPGVYRLDLPDAAVAPGADWLVVGVRDTAASGFAFYERYALATGVYLANDAITSAKVAAGALTYDDQITTFKSELSGMAITIPNGHITSAKIGADAFASDKFAAGVFVYGDQITEFDASIKSAASEAWNSAAGTVRVYPADGALTAAVFGADCITSAKVAAGAFSYDDQIVTFKSELSGMVVGLPDGHITAAKIGNDAITSAKVAAGAFTYDDQITTFKSELSGLYGRLTTQGVRDITQYTSAMGGMPGSSPALIDAIYWNFTQQAAQKKQTPTTYIVYNFAGAELASAPISGVSGSSMTIGVFSNV